MTPPAGTGRVPEGILTVGEKPKWDKLVEWLLTQKGACLMVTWEPNRSPSLTDERHLAAWHEKRRLG